MSGSQSLTVTEYRIKITREGDEIIERIQVVMQKIITIMNLLQDIALNPEENLLNCDRLQQILTDINPKKIQQQIVNEITGR